MCRLCPHAQLISFLTSPRLTMLDHAIRLGERGSLAIGDTDYTREYICYNRMCEVLIAKVLSSCQHDFGQSPTQRLCRRSFSYPECR